MRPVVVDAWFVFGLSRFTLLSELKASARKLHAVALGDKRRLRHPQIDGHLARSPQYVPSKSAVRARRILPEGSRIEIARDQLGVRPVRGKVGIPHQVRAGRG